MASVRAPVRGTSKPVGWASDFTKFHPLIPATEYIKILTFAISGNDPKFIYDLLNSATLHAYRWEGRHLYKCRDENDSGNGSWNILKKCEQEYVD